MRCASLRLRILPEKIGYFRFITEAYDGLATITTLDAKLGHVVVYSPAERTKEAEELIHALRDEIGATEISKWI